MKEQGGIIIGTQSIKETNYTIINFHYAKNISPQKNRYACDAEKANKYIYIDNGKGLGV